MAKYPRLPLKDLKPKVSESQIVNACIRWLWYNKCFVWRNNSGAWKPEGTNQFIRFGHVGSADIIGLTPSGRFLSVECKSAKGKLSTPQELFGERIRNSNGLYIVARSTDDLEQHKVDILA